jgi:hypothetical protein
MPPKGSDLIFDHRHNAAIRIVGRGSVTAELLAASLLRQGHGKVMK